MRTVLVSTRDPRVLALCTVVIALLAASVAYADYSWWPADRSADLQIPPDGWTWELHCPMHNSCNGAQCVQNDYEDNGDGVISAGDYVILGLWRVDIESVEYCYELWWVVPVPECWDNFATYVRADSVGPNPVGETWQEPCGGYPFHVDRWEDLDGNGVVSVGDHVYGAWGSIVWRIGWCATTPTEVPVPVKQTSWGKIKHVLGSRF